MENVLVYRLVIFAQYLVYFKSLFIAPRWWLVPPRKWCPDFISSILQSWWFLEKSSHAGLSSQSLQWFPCKRTFYYYKVNIGLVYLFQSCHGWPPLQNEDFFPIFFHTSSGQETLLEKKHINMQINLSMFGWHSPILCF